jgi:catechol 2,3-dioxygenase-like lactoylglutathione lyase family enzyme
MATMIGRLHHLVIDCPDPLGLAAFYSGLLGQPITYRSDDFAVVSADDTTSGPRVLALGATRLGGPGVYADPAGHPFCLIPRPAWAPPIPGEAG